MAAPAPKFWDIDMGVSLIKWFAGGVAVLALMFATYTLQSIDGRLLQLQGQLNEVARKASEVDTLESRISRLEEWFGRRGR